MNIYRSSQDFHIFACTTCINGNIKLTPKVFKKHMTYGCKSPISKWKKKIRSPILIMMLAMKTFWDTKNFDNFFHLGWGRGLGIGNFFFSSSWSRKRLRILIHFFFFSTNTLLSIYFLTADGRNIMLINK